MASLMTVRTGQECPGNAIRAPDKNNSVVCMWPDKEQGTFGRGDSNHYMRGLQAWFPWGGKEHDSQNLSRFQVLTGSDQYRYSWVRVIKVNRDPYRFKPYELGGYSPCIIDGLLGKAKIRTLEGWTSWDGKEVYHTGDVMHRSLVLCILSKTPAVNMVFCHTGQYPPPQAIKAEGCREGSFVAHWGAAEQGTFGRASANAYRAGLQAWFPHGGREHDSQNIGPFEIACRNPDFDYYWESIEKIQKNPGAYEVVEINGYCPAVINGLLGKASMRRGMAWTSWGGQEHFHKDHHYRSARVLCARMRAD